ncbi:MAG: hypothetical protein ABIH71_04855, partial [Candidatus Omnitrophota bacterium]
ANILKINTANQIEIGTGFGTHLLGPDTGPTTALQYTPKGYVDNKIISTVGSGPNGTTIKINTGTNQLELGNGLGAWVDCSAAAAHDNELAATDGFVMAHYYGNAEAIVIKIYTDSSNPPTTLRGGATVYYPGGSNKCYSTGAVPVKKGDYWSVVGDDNVVYWIPLGA